jgi:hypothetical protein
MPVQWFADIYNIRFNLYSVLHRRKKLVHEAGLLRQCAMDFNPTDLDHDGESFFSKLIARESAVTELTTARLMGNFIFLTDGFIPVQTGQALYSALSVDNGKGTFYSLGSDVNCLFYKPGVELEEADPVECFHALSDYATMTGRKFEPGYAEANEAFCSLLQSRKSGLAGSWFNIPGESTKDAFLRRLKKGDPACDIFTAYADEHTARWDEATTMSVEEALNQMPEIERKYVLECNAYNDVVFGLNEEMSAASKVAVEQLIKLAEDGNLQGAVDSSTYVGVSNNGLASSADLTASVESFEADRDKTVEFVLASKLPPGLEKR